MSTKRKPLPKGTKLGHYIIQKILGDRGSFGLTYFAIEKGSMHEVAIKEYFPTKIGVTRKENLALTPAEEHKKAFELYKEKFLTEVKIARELNHKNIIRVFTYLEKNNTAYMVMEYEKGQTLTEYLVEHPSLSEKKLLEIFCPINDGLAEVHKQGHVHRDVKPDNIYIRRDGVPILLDFGAARKAFDSRINKGDLPTKIYTEAYAPHEQKDPTWESQGAWTDIYAVAATIYRIITRQVVNTSVRASVLLTSKADGTKPSEKTKDPYQAVLNNEKLRQQYSHHFLEAIDSALNFYPNERPQKIDDWNKALLRHENHSRRKSETISEAPTIDDEIKSSETKGTDTPTNIKKKLMIGFVILFVSLVSIFFYGYTQQPQWNRNISSLIDRWYERFIPFRHTSIKPSRALGHLAEAYRQYNNYLNFKILVDNNLEKGRTKISENREKKALRQFNHNIKKYAEELKIIRKYQKKEIVDKLEKIMKIEPYSTDNTYEACLEIMINHLDIKDIKTDDIKKRLIQRITE